MPEFVQARVALFSYILIVFALVFAACADNALAATTSPYPIVVTCGENGQAVVDSGYYTFDDTDPCIFDSTAIPDEPFGVRYVGVFQGTIGSSTLVMSHQTSNFGLSTQTHNAPIPTPSDGTPHFFAVWRDRGFFSIDDSATFIQYVTRGGPTPTYNRWGYVPFVWGTVATATPSCTTECFSNVLFVPGIEASRLYGNDGSGERELWLPHTDTDGDALAMNADGTSLRPDIYTRDVIDNAYVWSFGDLYDDFLKDMQGLKSAGKINDWRAAPYDWRLTVDQILSSGTVTDGKISYLQPTSTPFIEQTLRELAASSKSGKVTIIAHSNGGLVTKRLLQKLGDAQTQTLVDKVILVASPQVGTPQAAAALLHGYQQGFDFPGLKPFITAATVRAAGDTMPGLFAMLPSNAYFTQVDDPLFLFSSTTLPTMAETYGEFIHSEASTAAFIADTTRTAPARTDLDTPTVLNRSLVDDAYALHASLDTWAPPAGIEVIQIAGWGMPKTVAGVRYALGQREDGSFGITIDPQFTVDGDGTVVVPSALWLNQGDVLERLWIDLGRYNSDHKGGSLLGFAAFNHARIFETAPIRNYLTDSVTGQVKALGTYIYLSDIAPQSNLKRLRFALHSPLSLDLFDDLGNHTGISTTTGEVEENVPGTYYTEFGGVKYLFTDASSTAHLRMRGYASGVFTLNVDQYIGDTRTSSTTFASVPTNAGTQVSLDVASDITTLSSMNIDKDGNGSIDASIAPVLDGTAVLDVVAPDIKVGFSTTTLSLVYAATDDVTPPGSILLSSTTTLPVIKKGQKTAQGTATTTVTAVDAAGNTTTLTYTEQAPRKDKRIRASFVSLTRNGIAIPLSKTTQTYKWEVKKGIFSDFAAYLQTPTTKLESHWRPKKNETVLMQSPRDLSDDNSEDEADIRPNKAKIAGLVVPYLITNTYNSFYIKYE
jgi:pimeloyl-ACP methyl ester carboxylesterase